MKKVLNKIYMGTAFIPLFYQIVLYSFLCKVYLKTDVWPKYGVNLIIPESLRAYYFFCEKGFMYVFFIAILNLFLGLYTRMVDERIILRKFFLIGGLLTSFYFLLATFIDAFGTYSWIVD